MIYVVKSGDTLQKISDETRIPVQKIIADNQLIYSERLVPGQALLLLGEGEEGDLAQGYLTAGYAYPFIDPPVLEEALPSLGRAPVFVMELSDWIGLNQVSLVTDTSWAVTSSLSGSRGPV